MTQRSTQTVDQPPRRPLLSARMVGASLVLGLAAAATIYLATSLAIPGPASMASSDELRERGAETVVRFCSVIASEPRFWPECRGGADEWRDEGASRLVAFCTRREPSRMFSASDCESDDRPAFAFTAPPGWDDALVGGLVTVGTLAVLVLRSRTRRVPGPGGAGTDPRALS